MDGQSVLALLIILAVVGGLTVRALPFIAGFLGVLHGLFIAPVVQTVKDFKARYLLMPEDAPDYGNVVEEEAPQNIGSVLAFPPALETETNPVPSFSRAGKQDGNTVSVSHTLEEATAYAEMILVDRLADLVRTGKLDKSIAIKVGMRAPTGRAYQAAKEKLETVMQSKEFPTLTKDGRPVASHLKARA